MSTELFRVIEHTIPCQHVREYRGATRSQDDDVLHLKIKQYVPLQASDDPDAVTIIGGHANGFPKETYEPLWNDLLLASRQRGFSIRSIWIADISHQGASAVANEHLMGNDPSCYDHARDLLSMINTFRSEIRRPIAGIGHSIGGVALTALSLMHPRLLSSLVLLEPIIQEDLPAGPNAAVWSTLRPDLWPSRAAAADALGKTRILRSLDPRVFDALLTYGLRAAPTAAHPDAPAGSVTLATPKLQEMWTYLRPNFAPLSAPVALPSRNERLLHPDEDYSSTWLTLFHRPELLQVFRQLPFVRPPVFFVFGSKSWMGSPQLVAAKTDITGAGLGGSGGKDVPGAVTSHVFKGWGHLFPLEHVSDTATLLADYLGPALRQWRDDEAFLAQYDLGHVDETGRAPSRQWLDNVRKDGHERRPVANKGKL